MRLRIEPHLINGTKVAEIISEEHVIETSEGALDLLGDLYYQDYDKIIIHQGNITPGFFDLKNGMAGEILQKFSNYRVRLVLVGDFSQYPGKSIHEFIVESNKGRQINFVTSLPEALNKLSED